MLLQQNRDAAEITPFSSRFLSPPARSPTFAFYAFAAMIIAMPTFRHNNDFAAADAALRLCYCHADATR